MERHPGLVPLSHQHYTKLVRAVNLKRAGTDDAPVPVTEACEQFLSYWDQHGLAHLREEEEILLATLDTHRRLAADVPEAVTMLVQHVHLHGLVAHLRARMDDQPLSADDLDHVRYLGHFLETHVRYEERTVFPMIQRTIPDAELADLAGRFRPPPESASCAF